MKWDQIPNPDIFLACANYRYFQDDLNARVSTKTYDHQHRTYIHTSGMYAPKQQNTGTAQKNTLTAPHSHTRKKKCTHHKKKKEKCTLQHQYARTWWCCACVRAHVCVYLRSMRAPSQKIHSPAPHSYTHQRHARTSSKTKHQHRTHTYQKKKKEKCALHQQYART